MKRRSIYAPRLGGLKPLRVIFDRPRHRRRWCSTEGRWVPRDHERAEVTVVVSAVEYADDAEALRALGFKLEDAANALFAEATRQDQG